MIHLLNPSRTLINHSTKRTQISKAFISFPNMSLSKSTNFFTHLKALANPHHHHRLFRHHPPSFLPLRFLSFATPEEAAAERRRRKRRLRIEPPLSSLHRNQTPSSSPPPKPIQNPNAPKLPETIAAVSGKRLNLHNHILGLIRRNDLEEATLYTRHSVYSNCRPTIFTVNAVLAALLRQSKYSDLLSLHRFITQASIAPNVITYNLLIQTYLDCRKPDTALEHYNLLINEAPFNPSLSTYRIIMKGLVDNGLLDKALDLKEDMFVKGFQADPVVYNHLMCGCVKNGDFDRVLTLFDELKEKLGGGVVGDGVVYGNLIKACFGKGMEKEAMEWYDLAVGKGSTVKMGAVGYNYVLDALCKNGKFDLALGLFERMLNEHRWPKKLTVNLGSFNVMVDGWFGQGKCEEAVEVFKKMWEYRCNPDVLSYNNLIEQLCKNGMLGEAERIYCEMGEKGVIADEFTYGLLIENCFKERRVDDGKGYFVKAVEVGLRLNLAVYNSVVSELVEEEKIDEAKSIFKMMMKKLKMEDDNYKFIMSRLKADEILEIVGEMLDDENVEFGEELQEFVRGELGKEGREDELARLMEQKEADKAKAKAEELEKAKRGAARVSISSLDLFGKKTAANQTTPDDALEATSSGAEPQLGSSEETTEANLGEEAVNGVETETRNVGASEQVTA